MMYLIYNVNDWGKLLKKELRCKGNFISLVNQQNRKDGYIMTIRRKTKLRILENTFYTIFNTVKNAFSIVYIYFYL